MYLILRLINYFRLVSSEVSLVCVCLFVWQLRPLAFLDGHIVWNSRTWYKNESTYKQEFLNFHPSKWKPFNTCRFIFVGLFLQFRASSEVYSSQIILFHCKMAHKNIWFNCSLHRFLQQNTNTPTYNNVTRRSGRPSWQKRFSYPVTPSEEELQRKHI